MPWSISKRDGKYGVIKDSDGSQAGCHATRDEAADQIRALYAAEKDEDDASLLDVLSAINALADRLSPPVEEAAVVVEEIPSSEHYAWEGPITYEGVETGDGRLFKENAVTWDESFLPFPFKWQRVSADGHDASITIGRVDSIFRADAGEIRARGVILGGPDAPVEAAQYLTLLKEGAAGGVSIDGDSANFEIIEGPEDNPYAMKMHFSSINIRALTAVDVPAFAGAKINLVDAAVTASSDTESGYYRMGPARNWESELEDEEAIIASGIPVDPPAEWFADPLFSELTSITITDEGQVFGHLCGKNTCHIGYGSCKTSPRNCDYDTYFHLGCVQTAEGGTVNVGHMTFGGGHAPLDNSAQSAAAYYDSTSRVAADIRCGEDEFGTWVVGALRPTLSKEDVREIRSAPLSGDWRPIGNKLQLIAAHAVNVPGFPIARAKVLVASGVTEALILTEECGCAEDEFNSILFNIDLEDELGGQ